MQSINIFGIFYYLNQNLNLNFVIKLLLFYKFTNSFNQGSCYGIPALHIQFTICYEGKICLYLLDNLEQQNILLGLIF